MTGKDNLAVWLFRGARWLLAGIFMVSGFPKLLAPNDFAVIISAYGLLPEALVFPAAVVLPAFELVVAAGLILDRNWALLATLGLYLVFIAILGYGIHLGLDIDCGCFGPEDPEHAAFSSLRTAFYRDLLLLLPVLYSLWYLRSRSGKLSYQTGEN